MSVKFSLPFGWRWKDVATYIAMTIVNLIISVVMTDNWRSMVIAFVFLMVSFAVNYFFVRRNEMRVTTEETGRSEAPLNER